MRLPARIFFYAIITENDYWYKLRLNYSNEDIIIDLHANILPLHQLTNSFWPGNKIR